MKKLLLFLFLIPIFCFGQTTLPFDQINPTLRKSFKVLNNGYSFQLDSIYTGAVATRPAITGNFQFSGDSFISGSGANPTSLRFSTQISTQMGLTEVNHGQTGLTLAAVAASPSTYIPTAGGSDQFLLICLGENDVNAVSTYTEHQFALDWVTTLNYTIAHGWAANKVWLTNIGFNGALTSGSYTAPQYAARQAAFSFCVDSIAIVYGCLDVKINQLMHYAGGTQLTAPDLLHPNNLGHTQIAKLAYNTYYQHLFKYGFPLEADGLTQLNQLSLPKIPSLPIGATVPSQLLGITTGDTVGRLNQLPTGIGTAPGGVFYLNGQIQQKGWANPSGFTLGTYDIGMNELSRLAAFYTPNPGLNIVNYLQLMDGSGNLNLSTSTIGVIQAIVNGTTVQSWLQNGNTSITGNVLMPNQGKKFYYDQGAYQGGFYPLQGTGATTIYTSYSAGFINFLVSNGTNGGSLEAGRISKLGNWLLGGIVENGVKLDVTGNGRFSTGVNIGILGNVNQTAPVGSTTGGTLTAATYFAEVIPIDAFGNLGNQTLELSTTTTGSTSSIAYSWTALANAVSYRVYIGTTSLGENVYLATSGTSITYTGSGTTSGALPVQNATYLANVSSTGFANLTGINNSALTASKVVFTDASKNLTSTGIGTSSQGIAGDGSLYTLNAKPHTIFTPTTGSTVTLTNNQYNIINPAGALLALTVTLPSSPANNDCVFIKFTQNVTTVTYSGGTVVDGITAPTAGGLTVLTYDSGTTSWY